MSVEPSPNCRATPLGEVSGFPEIVYVPLLRSSSLRRNSLQLQISRSHGANVHSVLPPL